MILIPTRNTRASRFISDGYPIVRKFEGIPNSLSAFLTEDDPTPMVLGIKSAFDRKGNNWFEIYPSENDQAYEPVFLGTVTQIDFWVWGANYNYSLEVLVRDSEGRVHTLQAGRPYVPGVEKYYCKHSLRYQPAFTHPLRAT